MSTPADTNAVAYEATFTTEHAQEVNCQRCKAQFPAGTKLQWIHSKDSTRAGRWLCAPCYNYYLSKGTTRRRTQPAGQQSLHSEAAAVNQGQLAYTAPLVVQKQVAAAQRQEGAYPVRAVGNIDQVHQASDGLGAVLVQGGSGHNPRVPGQPSQSLAPIAQNQHLKAAQSGNSPYSLPPLNLNSKHALPFPALKSKSLNPNPGYQEAHQFYNEMRAHFASKAYSSNANAQVVTVKAWMMMRVPGRKTAVPVSDIFEAIPNIPVHIGLADLKWVLYHSLLPLYVKWSKGIPLSEDECQVRNKLWVELIPKQPDIDAISDHFFSTRNKSNVKVFQPKQGIDLYLSITHEKYEAIMTHLDALNNKVTEEPSKPVLSTYKNKRKYDAVESESASAPPPCAPVKLTQEQVKLALQLQVPPHRKNLRPLFDNIMIPIKFFRPPARLSFTELVEKPQMLRHFDRFEPVQATLSYCPTSKPQQGAFKVARLGYTSEPLFGSPSTQVCVKQTFFISEDTKKQVIYQGQTQASYLGVELNCIAWASALMDVVYSFMKREEPLRGRPPFIVPEMRYVQAGLAISKDTDDKFSAFLLEEFIESDAPGWFVKYLNNSSAKPRHFKDKERALRAEFLSFAQHVQYIETRGLAFVSDLQGGRSLLTDPQVITNPTIIGLIFGEGNTNFEAFSTEHECNQFCRFYELPPPITAGHVESEKDVVDVGHQGGKLFVSESDDESLPEGILDAGAEAKSASQNSGTMPMEISMI